MCSRGNRRYRPPPLSLIIVRLVPAGLRWYGGGKLGNPFENPAVVPSLAGLGLVWLVLDSISDRYSPQEKKRLGNITGIRTHHACLFLAVYYTRAID